MKNFLTYTLLLLFLITDLSAQAYCSLRNPNKQIKKFYPTNTGYRTIVGTIDKKVTEKVSKVTGLRLHKNELGKHNLYTIKSGIVNVGLVHSRSDLSQWGLIESIWALNNNLTIADYDFQRCRSSLKGIILSDKYKNKIVGKNFSELKLIYNDNLKNNQSIEINRLFNVVIMAALKSIAVTRYCWPDDANKFLIQDLKKYSYKSLYTWSYEEQTLKALQLKDEPQLLNQFILHKNEQHSKIIFTPVSSTNSINVQKIINGN
ncbi:MAG: hypothetical protein NE330_20065 [Lentisphaeraceae bacterium]|nr:hypothetical protein [Lentisphaeraceae bacterium]